MANRNDADYTPASTPARTERAPGTPAEPRDPGGEERLRQGGEDTSDAADDTGDDFKDEDTEDLDEETDDEEEGNF